MTRGPRHRITKIVDDWMADSFLDPWFHYIDVKKGRGELVSVGNVLVDGPNLFGRPFRCDSRVCSPGLRSRGAQSCCAELEAAVTPAELRGVHRHFRQVDAVLRREDPSWARRPRPFEDCATRAEDLSLQLAKRQGRCVFSYRGPGGELRCAVHTAAEENGLDVFRVKPQLCSIFPLILQDLLDGTFLLSLVDEENAPLIGVTSFRQLPCLHGSKTFGDGPPAYLDFRGTLRHALSEPFVVALGKAARQWRRRNQGRFAFPTRASGWECGAPAGGGAAGSGRQRVPLPATGE